MENRRSKMTKKLIKEALIELLSKEDLQHISVKRICENADLNRSTFYLHYETIEELLEEFTNEEMKQIWTSDKHDMSLSDYKETLNYILTKPDIFKVLLKTGMYHNYIMNQYEKIDFLHHPKLSQLSKEAYMLICSYTTSGTEQLLLYMLNHPNISNVNEIAETLYNMNAHAFSQIVYLSKGL